MVNKIFKVELLWDWCDFGLGFRLSQCASYYDYHLSLTFQIGWLDIWFVLFRKGK